MTEQVLALPNRCFLRVSGTDATSFLHGQLTVAVSNDDRRPRLAAWCDAKGRVVALFRLYPIAEADWLLSFPADLAALVTRRMKMFVLRSDVQFADVSNRYLHQASPLKAEGSDDIAPILDLPTESGWREWLSPAPAETPAADATLALIQAGIPEVFAATSGLWVPQWLNLDLLNAVDFNKGCYPGQEVVAKLKYRGAVKRRMHLSINPPEGSEIVVATNKSDGEFAALTVQRQ